VIDVVGAHAPADREWWVRTDACTCVTEIREGVLGADEAFFDALLAADRAVLATILAVDFVIVDVMSGGVTERDALSPPAWCASSTSPATLLVRRSVCGQAWRWWSGGPR